MVVSTVRGGGPRLTVDRTIFELLFTLARYASHQDTRIGIGLPTPVAFALVARLGDSSITRSATVTSRRSRSWAACPGASCTTTRGWRWPRSWETVEGSVLVCSLNSSPTTCSRTDSAVPARVTTRARWRGWSDMLVVTSWCLYRRSRASMRSTPISRRGAWNGWGNSYGDTGRR